MRSHHLLVKVCTCPHALTKSVPHIQVIRTYPLIVGIDWIYFQDPVIRHVHKVVRGAAQKPIILIPGVTGHDAMVSKQEKQRAAHGSPLWPVRSLLHRHSRGLTQLQPFGTSAFAGSPALYATMWLLVWYEDREVDLMLGRAVLWEPRDSLLAPAPLPNSAVFCTPSKEYASLRRGRPLSSASVLSLGTQRKSVD